MGVPPAWANATVMEFVTPMGHHRLNKSVEHGYPAGKLSALSSVLLNCYEQPNGQIEPGK